MNGKKFGGRTKGTPNKINADLRRAINVFCENKLDEVVRIWSGMEGRDKVKFYIDLLSYCLPILQAIQGNIERDDKIIVTLSGMNGQEVNPESE